MNAIMYSLRSVYLVSKVAQRQVMQTLFLPRFPRLDDVPLEIGVDQITDFLANSLIQ